MLGSDPGRVPSGVTLDNWQESPHLHWSFQHIADLFPTQTISRGLGPVADLPWAASTVGDVVVADVPEGTTGTGTGRGTGTRSAPSPT